MFRSISHIVVNKVFTVMDDHHLCSPIEHLREETRMQKCLMIKLQTTQQYLKTYWARLLYLFQNHVEHDLPLQLAASMI